MFGCRLAVRPMEHPDILVRQAGRAWINLTVAAALSIRRAAPCGDLHLLSGLLSGLLPGLCECPQVSSGLQRTYDHAFHVSISEGSLRSARRVWPVVFAALGEPGNVVDVGCGLGAWLRALHEVCPACEFVGIDHPGVAARDLMIEPTRFIGADLASLPDLGRRFDLALSLEVAEHLAPERAPAFVHALARLADRIVFSAAVPGQGGHGHLNEQWPAYWIELFSREGYRCFDVVRPQIWSDEAVEGYYRQNILVFAKNGLAPPAPMQDWNGAALVHPQVFRSQHRSTTPRTLANLVRFLLRR